jgi:UDP-2,3-diacylglucosamine pyrophosphatase LpxH
MPAVVKAGAAGYDETMAPPSIVDELYSVSDLHFGGAPGTQIFNQGPRLAALVDYLQKRPKGRQVALVLNGDICDFLAEDGAAYLSPDRAVQMLERIIADPAFAPVFQALARFVRTPGRLLVLALGNHDVELALPTVQARLMQELCGEDAAARGRIVTAMDGQGFSCQVGPARVFCSHGNEVDSWNLVDYDALRRVSDAQLRGQAPPAWDPNAGTQLVIDVMNGIKRKFPFVDLLKPETKIVPPMILALDPSALGALKSFGAILYRKARGSLISGYLSAPAQAGEDADAAEDALRDLLAPGWQKQVPPPQSEEALLRQMEEDFRAGRRPLDLMGPAGKEDMLGLGQYIWDRLTGRPPEEAMRIALQDWLKGDRSYEITTADETSTRLDDKVDKGVDFVIAGHTHLMRAIPRKGGRGTYYNSGTWIRLIRLTDEMIASKESFAPVWRALSAGTMAAIDALPDLVLLRPTVVRIVADEAGVTGDLAQVQVGPGGKVSLVSEPGSRTVRS